MTFHADANGAMDGFRLVNLNSLRTYVTDITMHAVHCAHYQEKDLQEPFSFLGEVASKGLASFIAASCNGCGHTFTIDSPTVPGSKRLEVNLRGVWGSMVTGGGAAHLAETSATFGMPGVSQTSFTSIEHEIGEWWKRVISLIIMGCIQMFHWGVDCKTKYQYFIYIAWQNGPWVIEFDCHKWWMAVYVTGTAGVLTGVLRYRL
jgi:hypothetical protein